MSPDNISLSLLLRAWSVSATQDLLCPLAGLKAAKCVPLLDLPYFYSNSGAPGHRSYRLAGCASPQGPVQWPLHLTELLVPFAPASVCRLNTGQENRKAPQLAIRRGVPARARCTSQPAPASPQGPPIKPLNLSELPVPAALSSVWGLKVRQTEPPEGGVAFIYRGRSWWCAQLGQDNVKSEY